VFLVQQQLEEKVKIFFPINVIDNPIFIFFFLIECPTETDLTQFSSTLFARVLIDGKSQKPAVLPSSLNATTLSIKIEIDFSSPVCCSLQLK